MDSLLSSRCLSLNFSYINVYIQANVMLAYPLDEAETLLNTRLSAAKTTLANCEEDLDFLREQITVSYLLSYHGSLLLPNLVSFANK